MPNFDHTGPQGMGSRSGRSMGQCMNRGGGNMRNASEADAANNTENWQAAGMGADMGAGQGRCCRHGQRNNNRARNCAMNGQQGGMGQGMGSGMRQGKGMGRGMAPANQTDSCGTGSAPGSDCTDNNS